MDEGRRWNKVSHIEETIDKPKIRIAPVNIIYIYKQETSFNSPVYHSNLIVVNPVDPRLWRLCIFQMSGLYMTFLLFLLLWIHCSCFLNRHSLMPSQGNQLMSMDPWKKESSWIRINSSFLNLFGSYC